jgi:HK97 family phage prohead protease
MTIVADIYKSASYGLAFKDADIKKGIVTGYLSEFNTIDVDGDQLQKGAYSKSIKECGPGSSKPRIKYLQDHDKTKCVGVFQVLKEDNTGLYYEAKVGRHGPARDYLLMCEDGIITEHSVMFHTLKQTAMEGYNLITEVKLWEGSGLQAWGANSNTPIVAIKSHEEIAEMFKKLEKALKHGSYTDDAMLAIEQKYNELAIALKAKQEEMQNNEQSKELEPTNQPITKEGLQERIVLKGLNYYQYEALPEDKKDAYQLLDLVESEVKYIAGICGRGLLKDSTSVYANKILGMCKSFVDYIEMAEKAVLSGTPIQEEETAIETEKSQTVVNDSSTQPSNDTQPIEVKESDLYNILIKSLQNNGKSS